MKGRIFSLVFACAVLLSSANVFADDACNMTGNWLDGFNYRWELLQDKDALITGTVNQLPFCEPRWDVYGLIDTDLFALLATCPCDPECRDTSRCQNFTFLGQLAADCNSGSGTWQNCMVGDGTFTIARTTAGAEVEFQVNGNGPAPGAPARSFEQ